MAAELATKVNENGCSRGRSRRPALRQNGRMPIVLSRDATRQLQASRTADLDSVCYQQEFTYWKTTSRKS